MGSGTKASHLMTMVDVSCKEFNMIKHFTITYIQQKLYINTLCYFSIKYELKKTILLFWLTSYAAA